MPGEQTQCIACRATLRPGASLCPDCSSYQSVWKNRLHYAGSVIGVLSVVAVASLFVVGQAGDLRQRFFPTERLVILGASTRGDTVVANLGDKRAYLSRIFFYVDRPEGRQSRNDPIQAVVEPGDILRHDPWKRYGKSREYPRVEYPSDVPPDEWKLMLADAFNHRNCLDLAYFSSNDPEFRRVEEFLGGRLNRIPVEGFVEFYSDFDDNPRRSEFDAVAVVVRLFPEDCEAVSHQH